jgi:hypothetical protein
LQAQSNPDHQVLETKVTDPALLMQLHEIEEKYQNEMQLNKDLMNKLYHATQQKEALEKQLEKETPSMFNYCLNSYVPNPNDIID